MNSAGNQPTILYDGVCGLCSGVVSFLRRADRRGALQFVSLQSDEGRELLDRHHLPKDEFDSVVFVDAGQAFLKSTAILEALRYLPSPYRWGRVFLVFPLSLRDAIYDFVAKNRYRWF